MVQISVLSDLLVYLLLQSFWFRNNVLTGLDVALRRLLVEESVTVGALNVRVERCSLD